MNASNDDTTAASGAPEAALAKSSGPASCHQDTAHNLHGAARSQDAPL
jgi:hypothetical protein